MLSNEKKEKKKLFFLFAYYNIYRNKIFETNKVVHSYLFAVCLYKVDSVFERDRIKREKKHQKKKVFFNFFVLFLIFLKIK